MPILNLKTKKMKKLSILIFASMVLTLSITSCNSGEPKSGNVDSAATSDSATSLSKSTPVDDFVILASDSVDLEPEDKDVDDFVDKDNKMADYFHRILTCVEDPGSDCAKSIQGANKDCSAEYCGKPECIEKIICCHNIQEDRFNVLTKQRRKKLGTLTLEKIKRIMDGAKCENEFVRVRVLTRLHVERVQDRSTAKLARKSYYSIALLQGILDKGGDITTFDFYKGWDTDLQGQRLRIIPFAVNYKSTPAKYYDVSDTHP